MDPATVISVEYSNAVFPWSLQSTGGIWIRESSLSHDSVQLKNQLGTERPAHLIAHELQCPVVIDDHALASICWLTAAPQKLLCHHTRGCGALELARSNRLLHEEINEEALACLAIEGDHLVHRHPTAALLVDVVEASLQRV